MIFSFVVFFEPAQLYPCTNSRESVAEMSQILHGLIEIKESHQRVTFHGDNVSVRYLSDM